ncbi:MAG: hypothetical protein ACOC5T_01965 [Elusimicrobiota bacterium]
MKKFDCSYGKENREMIKEVNKAVIDLRTHYSNRLPAWGSVVISILTALAAASITAAIL